MTCYAFEIRGDWVIHAKLSSEMTSHLVNQKAMLPWHFEAFLVKRVVDGTLRTYRILAFSGNLSRGLSPPTKPRSGRERGREREGTHGSAGLFGQGWLVATNVYNTIQSKIGQLIERGRGRSILKWRGKCSRNVTKVYKNKMSFAFQTPYFWPSKSWAPENTDYAVYLCKRTMQNKARLELADYEAENLARLQKMFSRKWEYIFKQVRLRSTHTTVGCILVWLDWFTCNNKYAHK